jgi:hypothetical protein
VGHCLYLEKINIDIAGGVRCDRLTMTHSISIIFDDHSEIPVLTKFLFSALLRPSMFGMIHSSSLQH